ncbi:hypothetical protein [Microbacterium candidum]|uniref:Uncharacterized protein n=1 Tax=Microbacterium candidum TaxID=3041922 RepID=A0ABT7MX20_9MICO|nr:hypothetical protein [Microbacterium sp. ASV49]MDL9979002.1 hypothetical protein [Microbacterium sp. ASV49]
MAQDVVSLLFAGDPSDLFPRYEEGLRRYTGPAPEQILVSHGEEGLMVTLVWPDGVSHETLGEFMRASIGDLGLPFPRADHGTLAASSWPVLTAS